MIREMKKYNLPAPESYEESGSFKVVFRNQNIIQIEQQSDTQSDMIKILLTYCEKPKTAREIRGFLGISSKRYVAYNIIKPLIESGQLEYTNKNNINARNQKYITKK